MTKSHQKIGDTSTPLLDLSVATRSYAMLTAADAQNAFVPI